MKDESRVRDVLERMAREVIIVPVDPEPLVRRARRRLARTLTVGVAGAAVVVALAVGIAGLLRAAPPMVPAVPRPSLTPGPIPPTIKNGPLTLIGSGGGRIDQVDTTGAFHEPLIACGDSCSLIRSASWTPDGSKLAFVAECIGACITEGDPYHGIRVLDLRTGQDGLIAPGDDFGPVAWAPDGTQLAFTDRAGNDLSIIDADGSNVRTLPAAKQGIDEIESIAWSPDGTSIAYSTFPDMRMYIISIDGITHRVLGQGREPAWSADGARIAYSSADGCQIRTVAPDGSHLTVVAQLTRPGERPCLPRNQLAFASGPGWQPGPTWSPDGRMIAFIRNRGLFTIKKNGSDLQKVSAASTYEKITWRPVR
jgi:Tol biopolymer transport system component